MVYRRQCWQCRVDSHETVLAGRVDSHETVLAVEMRREDSPWPILSVELRELSLRRDSPGGDVGSSLSWRGHGGSGRGHDMSGRGHDMSERGGGRSKRGHTMKLSIEGDDRMHFEGHRNMRWQKESNNSSDVLLITELRRRKGIWFPLVLREIEKKGFWRVKTRSQMKEKCIQNSRSRYKSD